jgi:hypothetical protein
MTMPVDTRYIVIPIWDQNAALWQHCYCNLMLQLHSVFLQLPFTTSIVHQPRVPNMPVVYVAMAQMTMCQTLLP